MIVLDTSILSELTRSSIHPSLSGWLAKQRAESIATTTVTVMEITYGLQRLPNGKRRDDLGKRFDEFIEIGYGLTVLELDATSGRLAGALRARRDALGYPSQQADMMIAGICKNHEATLATRNIKDFSYIDLDLVNPFAS